MASTLITVAPTGAEHLKADVPQLPTTLDELVAEAKACQAAGVGLVHVHIRDADARPTLDLGRLKETVAALRRRGAHVETGSFGAMMQVALVNEGPVTLILEV